MNLIKGKEADMVKQTLLRLSRAMGRHWSGQHRRRAIQSEIQQVERLEPRQLMTAQFTGNYGPAAFLHDVTITLKIGRAHV